MGAGSVTVNNSASLSSGFFNAGGVVSLNAKASKGFQFSSWSTSGTTSFGNTAAVATTAIIGGPAVITANFVAGSPVTFPAILAVVLVTVLVAVLAARRRRQGLPASSAEPNLVSVP